MKSIHCVSYDKATLACEPEDLAEQLLNPDNVLFRDMSQEAVAVFQRAWDPGLDGGLWPPRGDTILKGFPK